MTTRIRGPRKLRSPRGAAPIHDAVGAKADSPTRTAAEIIRPFVESLLGRPVPVRIEFFDGSALGPPDGPGALEFRSPLALRRLVWSPGELGLARAFVSGDLEFRGDVFALLSRLRRTINLEDRPGSARWFDAVRAAVQLGAVGRPLPPPPEEFRPRRFRHSQKRDSTAIVHHYDVGNDFYRLVLGPSLTYSCALFPDQPTLEEAQAAKHELVCRKLGLHEKPGARLLDVGCGWGSMVMHAAAKHGSECVGITISREQADLARRRVEEAGLGERVEIRVQDYRELQGEDFDAICTIGMFEHVGSSLAGEYFDALRRSLRPGGRLLNHAISSPGSNKPGRRSFMYRYVFPDGELMDVGDVVLAMERAGFEVRDVEGLREHYVRTLRTWIANLESGWDEAVALVGLARARIWRLYMTGSANQFQEGAIALHQVLGVVSDEAGLSGMPPTRDEWRV